MKTTLTLFLLILSTVHISNAQNTFEETFPDTTNHTIRGLFKTQNGNYIAGGFGKGAGSGIDWDAQLIKFDSIGNIAWLKRYGTSVLEECYGVAPLNDGGIVMAGILEGPFPVKTLLMKTDNDGNLLWSKAFSNSTGGNEYAETIAVSADGSFGISGVTDDINGVNAHVIKTDGSGNFIWSAWYDIDPGLGSYPTKIAASNDGGFVLAGGLSSFSSMMIIKIDGTGNNQWSKGVNGFSAPNVRDIVQAKDDGFLVSGNGFSASRNSTDALLFKLDASGTLQWSKEFSFTGNCSAESIIATDDGGCALLCTIALSDTDSNASAFVRFDGAGN
ncbi:MAG: hypothetical protein ABIO46_04360, partial [Chitinophagales bacterium]